jgi:hypothetical protein
MAIEVQQKAAETVRHAGNEVIPPRFFRVAGVMDVA